MKPKATPYTRETDRAPKEIPYGATVRDCKTGEVFIFGYCTYRTGLLDEPTNTRNPSRPMQGDPVGVLMCQLIDPETGEAHRERFRHGCFDLMPADPRARDLEVTQVSFERYAERRKQRETQDVGQVPLDADGPTVPQGMEWYAAYMEADGWDSGALSAEDLQGVAEFEDRHTEGDGMTPFSEILQDQIPTDAGTAEGARPSPIITDEDGKRLCPSCGSVLEYDGAREALVCKGCGFVGTGRDGYTKATDPTIVGQTADDDSDADADGAEKCETAAEATEVAHT